MLADFFAHYFNAIGITGVALVLVAYFLLQIDRLNQDHISYSLTNLVGSGFILISLLYTWNLSSFIIEIFWLAISLFGLIKSIYRKIKSSPTTI